MKIKKIILNIKRYMIVIFQNNQLHQIYYIEFKFILNMHINFNNLVQNKVVKY